jgi:hypothetical protein
VTLENSSPRPEVNPQSSLNRGENDKEKGENYNKKGNMYETVFLSGALVAKSRCTVAPVSKSLMQT